MAGPQIGEQRQVLAQPQQAGFRARLVRHLVPFRPAHRAEQDGIGGLGLFDGLVGDRDLMGVVAATADQPLLGGEPVGALFVEEIDDAQNLRHYFRADAVAGEKKQFVGCHGRLAVTGPRGVLPGVARNGKFVPHEAANLLAVTQSRRLP